MVSTNRGSSVKHPSYVQRYRFFAHTLLILGMICVDLSDAQSARSCGSSMKLDNSRPLSTPQECARQCTEGESPKTCYYHFTVELYNVLGSVCELCTPGPNNSLTNECQCVTSDGVPTTVLTVNRMIPGPSIQVCLGDKVVVDVQNKMKGMELSIHWHGIHQEKSPYYDGIPFVTQCPIFQGNTFRYQWIAGNAGTHFWHSHTGLQEVDGIYGNLIIRQPPNQDPNSHLYDYDLSKHIVLISDRFHEEGTERFPGLLKGRVGQDPESLLINGKGRYTDPSSGNTTNTPLEVFNVLAGKKYRFRLITAFSTVCPAQLTVEGHKLTVIATDGQPVEPRVVDSIVSLAGERYDFIISANQTPRAYWIQLRAIGVCGITRVQQLAVLRYQGHGRYNRPCSESPTYDQGLSTGVVLNQLGVICDPSDQNVVCVGDLRKAGYVDESILGPEPDVKVWLPFHFNDYKPEDLFQPNTYLPFLISPVGINTITVVGNRSFSFPTAPLLSQRKDIPASELCDHDTTPANCSTPCICTHLVNVRRNSVIEIVLFQQEPFTNVSHPFHLHGYAFSVIGQGSSLNANGTLFTLDQIKEFDRMGLLRRQFDRPPSKDAIAVGPATYVILRFRAYNPGYWLFHCHYTFHLAIGMSVVFNVGDPSDLPPIPRDFPVCGNYLPPIEFAGDNSGN
ncbi:laccase-1-like [Neodiprion virginianus]|uniref:laccase-1-like n=1 Tax=Neodiprion virginianus TaxID=2961670 RepID=UPI001EE71C36|nr:laccase-1-like [Neodiprion virginianus]